MPIPLLAEHGLPPEDWAFVPFAVRTSFAAYAQRRPREAPREILAPQAVPETRSKAYSDPPEMAGLKADPSANELRSPEPVAVPASQGPPARAWKGPLELMEVKEELESRGPATSRKAPMPAPAPGAAGPGEDRQSPTRANRVKVIPAKYGAPLPAPPPALTAVAPPEPEFRKASPVPQPRPLGAVPVPLPSPGPSGSAAPAVVAPKAPSFAKQRAIQGPAPRTATGSANLLFMATAVTSLLPEETDVKIMLNTAGICWHPQKCSAQITAPNPWVGAIVVDADGNVVGEGFHKCRRHASSVAAAECAAHAEKRLSRETIFMSQFARGPGCPHAEVEAFRDAEANGVTDFSETTIYSTLEPCHRGPGKRTGPCDELVVSKGVKRCVIGHVDPDENFGGAGVKFIRDAGIQVDVGIAEEPVRRSFRSYLHHRRTARPYVVLKIATSLDGRVACADKTSQWITQAPARQDAHRLRAESQAVLVGSGTALADRPSLTVRLDGEPAPVKPPLRVVLDSKGQVTDGPLMETSAAPTLIFTSRERCSEMAKQRPPRPLQKATAAWFWHT
ncbi:ribD [Symbiodinium sp. CCMP2456]|nr:ribD [Symbiodinium sp. CCMP2456]